MIFKLFLVSFICVTFSFHSCQSLSCKDENGKDVDWFVLYKIPHLVKEDSPLNTGYAYAFLSGPLVDSHIGERLDEVKNWKLSDKLITDKNSFFGQTLAPIYSNYDPKELNYVLYNDSPPPNSGKESSNYAHAKGVIAMDSSSGFWLVHSVPNFPEAPEVARGYRYPSSGKDNGQSALCISFPSKKKSNEVVNQLLYMRPNVYNISISDPSSFPELVDLKKKRWPKSSDSNIAVIDSIRGKEFTSFSRNSKASHEGDLYTEFIAPHLSANLLVETWRRGAGTPLNSNCSTSFHVQNINEVKLSFSSDSSLPSSGVWEYLEDHSKWAIGLESETPYVCIGDINRMASQLKRGGGSVCFKNDQIWEVFKGSVYEIEGCPRLGSGYFSINSPSPTRRSSIVNILLTSLLPRFLKYLNPYL